VIPARSGSARLPRKNFYRFNEVSSGEAEDDRFLTEQVVSVIQGSGLVDEIYISTDAAAPDDYVNTFAAMDGVSVIMREDTINDLSPVADAVHETLWRAGQWPDFVLVAYPWAVNIVPYEMVNAFWELMRNAASSVIPVVPVGELAERMFTLDDASSVHHLVPKAHAVKRSQEMTPLYKEAVAYKWYRTEADRRNALDTSSKCVGYLDQYAHEFIDVDNADDMRRLLDIYYGGYTE